MLIDKIKGHSRYTYGIFMKLNLSSYNSNQLLNSLSQYITDIKQITGTNDKYMAIFAAISMLKESLSPLGP